MSGGFVQTLICSRESRVCWEKLMYIPKNENDEAYAKYLVKRHGEFFYDLTGEIKVASRKPRNVENWNG